MRADPSLQTVGTELQSDNSSSPGLGVSGLSELHPATTRRPSDFGLQSATSSSPGLGFAGLSGSQSASASSSEPDDSAGLSGSQSDTSRWPSDFGLQPATSSSVGRSLRSCVFDMSGVLSEEGFCPAGAMVYDFRGLGGTSCYCDDEAAETISAAVRSIGPDGIHWIDTGDYHYLTKFFLETVREPFELLLLDHHSDRQESAFGGILSCGSWVSEALRSVPHLRRVTSVGPPAAAAVAGAGVSAGVAADASAPASASAGVAAAGSAGVSADASGSAGVAAASASAAAGSAVAGVAADASASVADAAAGSAAAGVAAADSPSGFAAFSALSGSAAAPASSPATPLESAASITPSALPLYISIDLDVLSPTEFRTDWDQGEMSLEELLSTVSGAASGRRVIGIDICGGITVEKGATPSDLALNARLRRVLEKALISLC